MFDHALAFKAQCWKVLSVLLGQGGLAGLVAIAAAVECGWVLLSDGGQLRRCSFELLLLRSLAAAVVGAVLQSHFPWLGPATQVIIQRARRSLRVDMRRQLAQKTGVLRWLLRVRVGLQGHEGSLAVAASS